MSSIAYQIEEAIPGARAKPILKVAGAEGAILQKTQFLMFLIAALSLISAALGIANLMTASIMERSREIGLLKALGASDGAILILSLAETVITGIAGGLAGILSGLGLARVIGQAVFAAAVAPRGIVVPLVLALATGVTILGSLPAMRLLLSLRPAEVLHGR
ncbi:ABC transporter permease YtrF precursor [Moorella thermoacetica]|uniref:ABC transporter permease YtrF n=1 Tax=Neomoorella thermoacetica TaxID=1525 RepID=A0A1J5NYM9_NEOTH|nr:ABC transporter permease YtrF precursor [Moorella thermoacetica]